MLYGKLCENILRLHSQGCYVVLKVGDEIVPERLYKLTEVVIIVSVPKGALRFMTQRAKDVCHILKEVDKQIEP